METMSSEVMRIGKISRCVAVPTRERFEAMSFASRLKEARESAGKTQQQLASDLGIASSTIHRYERGLSTPNGTTINSLAEALGREPSWLLNGTEATDVPVDEDPVLTEFLKSKMGRTATDAEIARLRGLSARNGQPGLETYQGVLGIMRGTMSADPTVDERQKATGALTVKRRK